MVIDTINIKGIDGEITISFSKKTKLFSATFPGTVPSEFLSTCSADNYPELMSQINCVVNTVITNVAKTRDVILIYLYSSSIIHERKDSTDWSSNIHSMDGKGSAIGIKWAVLEEFNLPRKKNIGLKTVNSSSGLHRESQFETVNEKWYKLKDVSKYFSTYKTFVQNYENKLIRIDAPNADIWLQDYTHIMDYSEDIKAFLIGVESKMELLVENISNYFKIDTKILEDRIKDGIQLSLTEKTQ